MTVNKLKSAAYLNMGQTIDNLPPCSGCSLCFHELRQAFHHQHAVLRWKLVLMDYYYFAFNISLLKKAKELILDEKTRRGILSGSIIHFIP